MTLTDKAAAGYTNVTLRGGRITKWKGQAASYSPQLGTIVAGVSSTALALAGSSLLPSAALANNCSIIAPGQFRCLGPAQINNDAEIIVENIPVTVTLDPGFGMDVRGDGGFSITSAGQLIFRDDNRSTIISDFDALNAINIADGGIMVTSTGSITSRDRNAIYTIAYTGVGSTIISANIASGEYSGIRAIQGSGSLSIIAGDVTGGRGPAVNADNGQFATDLTIEVGDTTSDTTGIFARNRGTGALSITSTGTANGDSGYGIYARNGRNATNLTIVSNIATGGETGIDADNNGTGALSITTTGMSTGTDRYGIRARNRSYATDLIVRAAATTGGNNGIEAINRGTGRTSVTATGTATGTVQYGIEVSNNLNSTGGVTLVAAATSGGNTGILAINYGTGALSITATGLAQGTQSQAVQARNSSRGTDLVIDVAATSGGTDGIDAQNFGTGTLNITASGRASGTQAYGIQAEIARTATALRSGLPKRVVAAAAFRQTTVARVRSASRPWALLRERAATASMPRTMQTGQI